MKNLKFSGAGATWLIAMILYFTLFIGISATSNLIEEDNISNYKNDLLIASEAGGLCDDPRLIIDPSTDEEISGTALTLFSWRYNGYPESHLNCKYTTGSIEEQACVLEGCLYNNGTDTCEGTINASYYNIDVTETYFGIADRIADYTHPISFVTGQESACSHPEIIYDEELCRSFDCKWIPVGTSEFYAATEENSNAKDLYDDIKTMFSFRKTFNTDSAGLNFILYTIFMIIPLVILVIAIYLIFNPVK